METQQEAPEANPVTAKAAPTRQALPQEDEAYLANVKVELGAAKLGLLARRFESLIRDAQEAVDKYGREVIIKEVLGHKISVPIHCGILVTLEVKVGDAVPREWAVGVSPTPLAPPEEKAPRVPDRIRLREDGVGPILGVRVPCSAPFRHDVADPWEDGMMWHDDEEGGWYEGDPPEDFDVVWAIRTRTAPIDAVLDAEALHD